MTLVFLLVALYLRNTHGGSNDLVCSGGGSHIQGCCLNNGNKNTDCFSGSVRSCKAECTDDGNGCCIPNCSGSDAWTGTTCGACPTNSSAYNLVCVCEDNYFNKDPDGLDCQKCSTECARCPIDDPNCVVTCEVTHAFNDADGDCVCPLNSSDSGGICVCDNIEEIMDCSSGTCQCVPCPTDSSRYDSVCVCKDGYYNSDPSGLTCTSCTTECQRCITKDDPNCFDCTIDHAYKDPTTGDCVCPANSSPHTNSCVCEEGYYNSDSSGLTCTACTTDCGRCPVDDPNCSVSCTVTHASNDVNGDCVCPANSSPYDSTCVCEDGYYNSDSSGLTCTACTTGCQRCPDKDDPNCIDCTVTIIRLLVSMTFADVSWIPHTALEPSPRVTLPLCVRV